MFVVRTVYALGLEVPEGCSGIQVTACVLQAVVRLAFGTSERNQT